VAELPRSDHGDTFGNGASLEEHGTLTFGAVRPNESAAIRSQVTPQPTIQHLNYHA
jgi:hypothetical protein